MAFITKAHLSRRTFLRGAGVTLALPLLESMIPAATLLGQTAARPRTRFGAIYFPHGAIMSQWTPAAEGAGFELTPILQPLKPFYSQITVVSDLEHKLAYGSGATANHNRSAAAYLSAAFAKTGATPQLGITMDQVVAQKLGQDTPLPSLELMIEGSSLNCGDGLSCSYRDTISWQGPSAPLPMQNNPQVVFERLFGDGTTADLRKARRQQSISLLDSVTGEVSSLQRKLPTGDRSRLDQYLTDVREIERRIQNAEAQAASTPFDLESPVGPPEAFDEHVAVLFDLLAAAFQADVTRVFTFMMMRDVTSRSFPHIGVSDPHHALSHEANGRSNDPSKPVKFATVNTHFVSMFATFVEKLRATPDGEGTLLDNSIVLFGSGMGNANDHTHHPLPITLVGGGAGQMRKLNQHIAVDQQTPMANLLLALAQKTGTDISSFGLSTGALDV